jgi:hypothetical protein
MAAPPEEERRRSEDADDLLLGLTTAASNMPSTLLVLCYSSAGVCKNSFLGSDLNMVACPKLEGLGGRSKRSARVEMFF